MGSFMKGEDRNRYLNFGRSLVKRLPSWFRVVISFVYGLSLFRIWAIIAIFLIIILKGDILTKDGLWLALLILLFLILYLLNNWLDDDPK